MLALQVCLSSFPSAFLMHVMSLMQEPLDVNNALETKGFCTARFIDKKKKTSLFVFTKEEIASSLLLFQHVDDAGLSAGGENPAVYSVAP